MYSHSELIQISNSIADQAENLFEALEIQMENAGRYFYGPCFIHGGDNPNGLNFYPDGHTVKGLWRCNTHACQNHFLSTPIGFVRGVISHRKYGWAADGDKQISFTDALHWCKLFLVDKHPRHVKRNVSVIKKDLHFLPKQVLQNLEIPANYYVNRGYSSDILRKYDIGLCATKGKQMYCRVVVPIYDDNHEFIVGCTGRSIFEACTKCGLHHGRIQCEKIKVPGLYNKWRHSKGLNVGQHLFNFWFAKEPIRKSRKILLVEGPGDVLRLEMAGIHNSCGTFGNKITDAQQILIEKSGAEEILVAADNDKAGLDFKQDILTKLRKYKITYLDVVGKDVGDMSIQEIQRWRL